MRFVVRNFTLERAIILSITEEIFVAVMRLLLHHRVNSTYVSFTLPFWVDKMLAFSAGQIGTDILLYLNQ